MSQPICYGHKLPLESNGYCRQCNAQLIEAQQASQQRRSAVDKRFMFNIKWQTASGYQASLTVADDDLAQLRKLAGEAMKAFKADVAPAVQANGHQANGHQPASEAKGQPPEGFCPIHQLQMAQQSNGSGSWWSHKVNNKWCKGKAQKEASNG